MLEVICINAIFKLIVRDHNEVLLWINNLPIFNRIGLLDDLHSVLVILVILCILLISLQLTVLGHHDIGLLWALPFIVVAFLLLQLLIVLIEQVMFVPFCLVVKRGRIAHLHVGLEHADLLFFDLNLRIRH